MEYMYVFTCMNLEENPEIQIPIILGSGKGLQNKHNRYATAMYHEWNDKGEVLPHDINLSEHEHTCDGIYLSLSRCIQICIDFN